MVPKKISSQDLPTIVLVTPCAVAGEYKLVATAKLLGAHAIFDGSSSHVKEANAMTGRSDSLQNIRKNNQFKDTDKINMIRFVNLRKVAPSDATVTAKLKSGWGVGKVPVNKFKPITSFIVKRPFSQSAASPEQPSAKRRRRTKYTPLDEIEDNGLGDKSVGDEPVTKSDDRSIESSDPSAISKLRHM